MRTFTTHLLANPLAATLLAASAQAGEAVAAAPAKRIVALQSSMVEQSLPPSNDGAARHEFSCAPAGRVIEGEAERR